MKKNILKISIVFFIILSIILICVYLISVCNIGVSQKNNQEILLLSTQSPDEKYNLYAYRTEPGATVDFSVKVYSINDEKKELIYNAYHEYDAEIIWINNTTVSINGKTLNLSQGEKYDWRDNTE